MKDKNTNNILSLPNDGYRWVNPGEVLKAGDECFSIYRKTWVSFNISNNYIIPPSHSFRYRRKIKRVRMG